MSSDVRKQLGITHIVSVCPEFPSTGPNHLTIAVDDCEYDDLLIHLPKACLFVQKAVEEGGRILVHCVMGVSRSATVLSAYCTFMVYLSTFRLFFTCATTSDAVQEYPFW